MTTEQIWKKYRLDVYRFILSKVKDESKANDILQEVFVKVHTKIHQLNDDSKIKSWLFSIARNLSIDELKQKSSEELNDNLSEDSQENHQTHTKEDCLTGILNKLPKKYKQPLYLSDIKGLKQKEVAEKLDLPLATVKSQIQRGRKLIKQGYKDCCNLTENKEGFLVGEIKPIEDCKICNS